MSAAAVLAPPDTRPKRPWRRMAPPQGGAEPEEGFDMTETTRSTFGDTTTPVDDAFAELVAAFDEPLRCQSRQSPHRCRLGAGWLAVPHDDRCGGNVPICTPPPRSVQRATQHRAGRQRWIPIRAVVRLCATCFDRLTISGGVKCSERSPDQARAAAKQPTSVSHFDRCRGATGIPRRAPARSARPPALPMAPNRW
jgi:hypothetical protein